MLKCIFHKQRFYSRQTRKCFVILILNTLWQLHCSILMTQHVFCTALPAHLRLRMTAANTWSAASLRLCQVLVLRPWKPVTIWNFFSSFTFCSSPTGGKRKPMLPSLLAIPSLSGCAQFLFPSPRLCTCLCWKHCSVLLPEVGAEELGSAWQSLFLMEDHGVLINANKTSSQRKVLDVKLGTHIKSPQRPGALSLLPGTRWSLWHWNFGKDNCSFQRMSRKAICVTGNVLLGAIPLAEHLTLSWAHNTYKVKRILLSWVL